jgi:hypothetical protein
VSVGVGVGGIGVGVSVGVGVGGIGVGVSVGVGAGVGCATAGPVPQAPRTSDKAIEPIKETNCLLFLAMISALRASRPLRDLPTCSYVLSAIHARTRETDTPSPDSLGKYAERDVGATLFWHRQSMP